MEIPPAMDTVYVRNITGNLPKIPRSKLVMERNTQGNLYIATDSGIFVTTTDLLNQNQWCSFSTASHSLPLSTISDMEINELENRIYVATYGRGLWSSPTAVFGNDRKVLVKKNSNWNSPMKIDGDLVVRRGRTLEINGVVYISEFAKVILQKGARLKLSAPNLLRNNDGSSYDFKKIQRASKASIVVEDDNK